MNELILAASEAVPNAIDLLTAGLAGSGTIMAALIPWRVQRRQERAATAAAEKQRQGALDHADFEDALRARQWQREQKLNVYSDFATAARDAASQVNVAVAASDGYWGAPAERSKAATTRSRVQATAEAAEFIAPPELGDKVRAFAALCDAEVDALFDEAEAQERAARGRDPLPEYEPYKSRSRELRVLALQIHAAMQVELGLSSAS
ncbi:hypothetical protein [Pseudoclavibacter sp. 8L]|uniref:hypothetical protein n=1 Tax=Pseudoclavibacter sp. 8L TaxID=2653162 RepID=UPI0012F19D71|nr:hypothetical protein [Pseudoclavibacter sp. 8L]VXB84445.1 hypothetical protein PSCLAVI8L_20036 [Pseudoclavibacter sp. 8L]